MHVAELIGELKERMLSVEDLDPTVNGTNRLAPFRRTDFTVV